MTRFVALGIYLLIVTNVTQAPAAPLQTAGVLTNDDVVNLKKAGISDDLIILKINQGPTKFTTEPSDLVGLKKAGISDAVVTAMLKASSPGSIKSKIYFYRYKQFTGSMLSPSVYCDEKELARIDNGRYFVIEVDSGKHTLRSNDQQSGIELEVEPGKEYFVRVELATGLLKGHGRLMLTPPEQGNFEVKKLEPLDFTKIRDREKVVTPKKP